MIAVCLTSEQFDTITLDAHISERSRAFLALVFVAGADIAGAARSTGVSVSRGYNLASYFRGLYTTWLADQGLTPVLSFTAGYRQ